MKLIDKLKNWGCDIDGAMSRFLDDEETYIMCIDMVITDKNFSLLKVALENNNVEAAFDAAHTLKGVVANMGLTPMFNIVERIVEPLRKGESDGILPIYDELIESLNYLKNLVAQD